MFLHLVILAPVPFFQFGYGRNVERGGKEYRRSEESRVSRHPEEDLNDSI